MFGFDRPARDDTDVVFQFAEPAMTGERVQQPALFAVVERQRSGVRVDELKLPGHQHEAVFERGQCLGLQLPGSAGEVQQVTQLPGEVTDPFNAMGLRLARELLQRGE